MKTIATDNSSVRGSGKNEDGIEDDVFDDLGPIRILSGSARGAVPSDPTPWSQPAEPSPPAV